jgi:hypothetical protein
MPDKDPTPQSMGPFHVRTFSSKDLSKSGEWGALALGAKKEGSRGRYWFTAVVEPGTAEESCSRIMPYDIVGAMDSFKFCKGHGNH